jgi:hypothetical protein
MNCFVHRGYMKLACRVVARATALGVIARLRLRLRRGSPDLIGAGGERGIRTPDPL